MEKKSLHHEKLNELTCLALGKAAHIEDMLESLEPLTLALLNDTLNIVNQA